jgi:manganese/zinc/iron transport system permease protein
VVGTTSGILGCFALLRRQSLLGDTLAHASLPGVCLAYLVTGHKDPWTLLAGAVVSGMAGTLLVLALRASRLKPDAALGLVLSTFFGLGVMILAYLQNRGDVRQSGLEDFIFGQVGFLTREHLRVMLPIGLAAVAAAVLFYKELKLVSFDPDYADAVGFSRRLLELLMALLTVAGVMISLRAIGVVLTTALLIVPAAAARQWTQRLSRMILLAVAFGVLSGVGGAVWSQSAARTPAGPTVTLVATGLLAVSLTLAPRRGVVWGWLRLLAHRAKVRRENLLTDLYRLGEANQDWRQGHTAAELAAVRGQTAEQARRTLSRLAAEGKVEHDGGRWRPSAAGLAEAAQVVRNHRLWELYLTHRLDLPADHVHRDAEAMEHALPPEVVQELETLLGHATRDPHGRPIPAAGRPG